MKKFSAVTLIAFAVLTSAFTVYMTTEWKLSDDYSIKFETKRAKGIFKGLQGAIRFDENNLPESNFDVTVDVHTIDTGIKLKNKHAKGKSFFNAAQYPVIRYQSTSVEKSPEGFVSRGNLTIKGVTRPVMIPFTFESTGNAGTFRGHFEINRKDYNLHRMGVGKIVKIELVVPVTR